MSSNSPGFAIHPSAPRASEAVTVAESAEPPPSAEPASKRPPPLPASALLVPLSDDSPSVEQLFFREGVDGHAESVPPSGRYPFPLSGNEPVAGWESSSTAGSTIAPTSLDEEWLDLDEDVEDPVRTRRRRAARLATAWGTVAAIAIVGAAVFLSPRRDARSAAAPSMPATAETVAHSLAAIPTPPAPASAARAPATDVAAPASGAAMASAASVAAPPSARTAARTPAFAAPVARPAPMPRAASAHATRGRHAPPTRSTSKSRSHAPAPAGSH